MQYYAEVRKARGMSQAEAAERIGVSVPTIRRWEYGRSEPDAMYVAEMALVYQVSADALLGLKPLALD